ncbi:MAG TPA: ADOP family duplicated permease [Bryobacteraceae bacterium]|nr:ADOP family duplicated permease [Bryobacteraceae bacterium]
MSWIGRFTNLFRRDRLHEEIAEELASHIAEAVERGRSAGEVRKAFGNELLQRERSRDIKLVPWLDSLASDVVFGWRQLRKRPAVSTAAILSLALAIGATTAAFRLVDAVLLRTLPVAHPDRLFYLAVNYVDRDGQPDYRDDFDYPTFQKYREAVADRADLMVVGINARQDVVFGSAAEPERVYRQYISGNVFNVFSLQAALGRLIAPYDDLTTGGSPVAVLSYEYWTRRFARDPGVLGKTFRMGSDLFRIVGVAPRGFIGTEPGAVTDVFVPAMMNTEAIHSLGWSWFRIWMHPKPGFSAEQVRQLLQVFFLREHQERLKEFDSRTAKTAIKAFLNEKLLLLPAASGASDVKRQYRRPLLILAALVILVLLIACMNVGNLLAAQAAARAREMALRVSIGAGQWRLIQLVLMESTLLAAIASALGTFFASWSAPLVVSMLHVPEDPVRLVLNSGWRSLAFSVALTSLVALLFGLAPALRASGVKPISALKGGQEPPSRRRGMKALLAAQMAFCVLVQFVAGLFVASFQRLSNRPLGFSAEHVLVMDLSASQKQPLQVWMQMADQLHGTPGVQSAALAGWPLLSRNRWTEMGVRVPGKLTEGRPSYVLDVSPGFFETMRIDQIDGRDFRRGDLPPRLGASTQPLPGVGIVNEAFARVYFKGENPVGRSLWLPIAKDLSAPMQIVGYVRDAVYYDVRERVHPTMYLPMNPRQHDAFLVRAAGDPLALAPTLRSLVLKARSDFQVHTIETQSDFIRWQMLRERLLATLSLFFAIVALLLAVVGLYGLLNYLVTQQRREIGIRIALGARPTQVVRRVTTDLLAMVSFGLFLGLAGGLACGRFVESILYEVKPTNPGAVAAPLLALFAAALLAVLPPAIRAVHIDPAETLRSE